jgi:hypothetical protein
MGLGVQDPADGRPLFAVCFSGGQREGDSTVILNHPLPPRFMGAWSTK